MILVEISYFYLVIYARIIFKIENGYILQNDKSNTKLKDDDIYIGKIFTNYVHFGNNGTYYYRIKFKRYKQENVVFHFYNVYTIQDNDGNYICPKVYAIDTTASVLKNACIGTKATPLMMQCCNDCKYNFCIDDIERRSLSKNYHFLYRSRNYNHDNGHPLWVPRYHIFPDNLESFVIPANEWAYVPRVKCDRCDSVQFIINNTIYNSKYFGKTKLFSPIIPTNGYDYFPYDDLKNVKANKLNSLKGITNQDVRVIAICNDNNNSYCYSKCIEPEGYSVIQMKDTNGINVYSGNISIEAPDNIYERGSQYQVINNDEIPKNSYCSKSWNGKIDFVPNLSYDKMTISIVNTSDTVKTIKTYLGNVFIPFSRTNLFADTKNFLENLGLSNIDTNNAVVLEENSNISENFYVILNFDGSIQVNTKYFNERNLKIGKENFIIPSSYVESTDIIHEEFVNTQYTETQKLETIPDTKYFDTEKMEIDDVVEKKGKSNKTVIIVVCCIVAAVVIVIIIIFLIKLKNKGFGKTNNNDKSFDMSLIEN